MALSPLVQMHKITNKSLRKKTVKNSGLYVTNNSLKCSKHPYYKGIKPPKAFCFACFQIWDAINYNCGKF